MAKYSASHSFEIDDGKLSHDRVWLNHVNNHGSMFIDTNDIPEVIKKLQTAYDLASKLKKDLGLK